MTPPERYRLRLGAAAPRALDVRLSPAVALAVWEFRTGPLCDNPYRVGRQLAAPFQGRWAARRGAYRIHYRIDDEAGVVTVLDIAGRADAYHSGRA